MASLRLAIYFMPCKEGEVVNGCLTDAFCKYDDFAKLVAHAEPVVEPLRDSDNEIERFTRRGRDTDVYETVGTPFSRRHLAHRLAVAPDLDDLAVAGGNVGLKATEDVALTVVNEDSVCVVFGD